MCIFYFENLEKRANQRYVFQEKCVTYLSSLSILGISSKIGASTS